MKGLLAKNPFNQTGLYGLGSYARRFAEQGDNARAAELGEFLIRQMGMAKGATSKITVLRAIENSAYAPAIGTLQRYFDDRDPFVRAAAIEALRPMKDPLVDQVLASRTRSSPSEDETLLILGIAERRKPSEALIGAVVDLSTAAEVRVRRQAVGLLAKWAPEQPQLRYVLKKIGDADPDSQVRANARAAL